MVILMNFLLLVPPVGTAPTYPRLKGESIGFSGKEGWFSYRVLPPAPDLKRVSHRCNALGECTVFVVLTPRYTTSLRYVTAFGRPSMDLDLLLQSRIPET